MTSTLSCHAQAFLLQSEIKAFVIAPALKVELGIMHKWAAERERIRHEASSLATVDEWLIVAQKEKISSDASSVNGSFKASLWLPCRFAVINLALRDIDAAIWLCLVPLVCP